MAASLGRRSPLAARPARGKPERSPGRAENNEARADDGHEQLLHGPYPKVDVSEVPDRRDQCQQHYEQAQLEQGSFAPQFAASGRFLNA